MRLHVTKALQRKGWLKTVILKQFTIPLFLLLYGAPAGAVEFDKVSAQLFELQLSLAVKGDRAAQYYVAEMYEKSLGTEQNLDQAYAWYKKSAEGGDARAKNKINAWERTIKRNAATDEPLSGPVHENAPTPTAKPSAVETHKPKQTVKSRNVAKAIKPEPQGKNGRTAALPGKTGNESAAARHSPPERTDENAPPLVEDAPKPADAPAAPTAKSVAADANPPAEAPPSAPAAAQPENAAPVPAVADEAESFLANPCKSTSARFISNCRQGKTANK